VNHAVKFIEELRLSRGHKLVDSCDNENIRAAVREVKTILCEKHSTETIKVYCLTCKEAICMMCFVESHKLHECSDVMKVVDQLRQQMKNDIKNMNETLRKCDDALKEHGKNEDYLNKAVEEMEKQIIDRAEKVKKEIDLEKQKLLEELASRKAERMKKIKQVTENIERQKLFVMSLGKYTEELREQGSASDVAQQEGTLHKRADELTKVDVYGEIVELGCIDARVELSTEAVECVIGRIKWQVRVKGESLIDMFECSERTCGACAFICWSVTAIGRAVSRRHRREKIRL
jgi:transketolase